MASVGQFALTVLQPGCGADVFRGMASPVRPYPRAGRAMNRTVAIVLALIAIGLAVALVPVVLHAGFGVEVWPLTRLPPPAAPIEGNHDD